MTDETPPASGGADTGDDDEQHHLIGNSHAEGNDGGAPAQNVNAMRHGAYADPDNLLQHLKEHDEAAMRFINRKFDSYMESAPFDRDDAKADQLMQICVRELSIWRASGIQIREGVVSEQAVQGSDGEWFVAKKENPANQALSRLERDVTKRLKELGILGDSPDARLADAAYVMASDDYAIEVGESEDLDGESDDGDPDEWVIERPNEDGD